MRAVTAKITKALNVGCTIKTCDNSGAKVVQIISVKRYKGRKNRLPKAGVGDEVTVAVLSGKPDMRKKTTKAVIVRQRKEYRRPDGTRIQFEDNSAVVLKDDKGNPKGTIIKGPIAKEVAERWPGIAKVASIII